MLPYMQECCTSLHDAGQCALPNVNYTPIAAGSMHVCLGMQISYTEELNNFHPSIKRFTELPGIIKKFFGKSIKRHDCNKRP